jgi:hypothetical protein
MRRERERRAFMTLWLAGTIGPGDTIVADAYGAVGPGRGWDLAPAPIALTSIVVGWHDLFGTALLSAVSQGALTLLSAASSVVTLAVMYRRRAVYAAVAGRDLILVEMRRNGRDPVRLLIRVPVATLQLTTKSRLGLDTVTCARLDGRALDVAGEQKAMIRIMFRGRRTRRQELADAAAALGAAINLPLAPMALS